MLEMFQSVTMFEVCRIKQGKWGVDFKNQNVILVIFDRHIKSCYPAEY